MVKKKSAGRNTFQSSEAKNSTKKKPRKRKKPSSRLEKIEKIGGLISLGFAFVLLFSFTSFLFTWKYDQSLIRTTESIVKTFEELKPDIVHNWVGVLGAYLSHLFICRWFGVASFLFIFIFAIIGFRGYFGFSLVRLKNSISNSLFFIFWTSITLGFLFHTNLDLLGGGFGYHAQFWLRGIFGGIGTGFFLVIIILIYLVIKFNYTLKIPDILFGKKDLSVDDEIVKIPLDEEIPENEETTSPDEGEITVSDEKTLKEETKEEDEPVIREVEDKPDPVSDGVDFEVEKAGIEDNGEESEVEMEAFDPTLELSNYKLPPLDLLKDYGGADTSINENELEENKNLIIQTLRNYGIEIDKIKATVGSTITLYEIVPSAGIRISKIKNLEDDIALSLAALGIRIIAPIPGKGTVGIEVPNKKPEIVSIRSVLGSSKFRNSNDELPFALGRTISNEVFMADLVKMPHLLIAGATGQGKSVGLNVIIASLLYKKHPAQVKFVFVDPKKVELSLYSKIEKHYLAKLPDSENAIITDVDQVVGTLKSLTQEMDDRYLLLKEAHVRNIVEYNTKFINRRLNPQKGHRFLPYIVLVVDELADLMMTAGKEVEMPIARLAQLARAIGIHLILATQRPSVNIITGTIKANFPARIAFKVSAAVDSRTILDSKGAEQLVGKGDMLFSTGSEFVRIQCAFIDTPEVDSIVDFISDQPGFSVPFELPEVVNESDGTSFGGEGVEDLDELFEEAARIVVQHQQGSTSLLQRRLKLGYNRAGRIIDQLESAGVVGPFEGSKARSVLIPDEYTLEQFLKDFYANN